MKSAPFKIVAVLAGVALLAGCANCGDQPGWGLLAMMPAGAPIISSQVADDLWLTHPGFSIAIGPCRGNPASAHGRDAALCAKLFVREGYTLRFEGDRVELVDLARDARSSAVMKGQGFRPLEPIVGSNFSANAGVSRFYNEPGTPEYFRLLSERPDGPLSIAFPRVLLNAQWLDLPEVRADPIQQRRCARGVW